MASSSNNKSDMTSTHNEPGPYSDMAAYNYALTRAQQETSADAERLRPDNTKKAYKGPKREFLKWCTGLPEPEISRFLVSGDKLNLFLKNHVSLIYIHINWLYDISPNLTLTIYTHDFFL
jgi:hypothetical protein